MRPKSKRSLLRFQRTFQTLPAHEARVC
jgi:hypothetical protein